MALAAPILTKTKIARYIAVDISCAECHINRKENIRSTPSTRYAVALRYKLEGCGLVSRWCHWNFLLA
jgi:hypothetical protein